MGSEGKIHLNEHKMGLDEKTFSFIVKMVHSTLGIVLGAHKKNMVYRRLSKRIIGLGMSSFSEYCNLLKSSKTEQAALANAITTNLTSFFREKHHFDYLKEELPGLLETYPNLKIWSAGCSSGCEPYSIAMVVAQAMKGKSACTAKILATDIDTEMLDDAIAAEYSLEALKKIPIEYHKYLTVNKEYIGITKEIKKYVFFKRLNLLEDWPMKQAYNIIFCRNTVIYFDRPTQAILFNRFADMLIDQGLMFIGHSETMNEVSNRYQSCSKTIYRKIL